jgi:hypothetical protein
MTLTLLHGQFGVELDLISSKFAKKTLLHGQKLNSNLKSLIN